MFQYKNCSQKGNWHHILGNNTKIQQYCSVPAFNTTRLQIVVKEVLLRKDPQQQILHDNNPIKQTSHHNSSKEASHGAQHQHG